jgi:hypothetical protein
MKRELSLMASFVILSSVANAGGSAAPVAVAPVWDVPIVKENFFVYLSGGIASADVSSNIQENIILLPEVLNDGANVIEAGVGYRHSEDVFATAFIQNATLDQVNIFNINASVNYRFSDLAIMPYVGAVVGYSMLEWDEVPVDTTGHQNVESKLDADHMTFGIQAGAEYELGNQITLFGKYQVLTFDHLMEIFQDSEIEHANLQNVQGGIRYEF